MLNRSDSQVFIDHFVNNFLPNVRGSLIESKSRGSIASYISLVLTITLILCSTFTLKIIYEKNVKDLEVIQDYLTNQYVGANIYPEKILQLEDILSANHNWYNKFYTNSSIDQTIYQALDKVKLAYINEKLIPIFVTYLEDYLSRSLYNDDIEFLINAFNVYLMLKNLEPFNNKIVKEWFKVNIKKISTFSGNTVILLDAFINKINAETFLKINFDEDLYNKLMFKFNGLNISKSINHSIINKFREEPGFRLSDFLTDNFLSMFKEDFTTQSIPYIYTNDGYHKYLNYQKEVLNKVISIKHLNKALDLTNLKNLAEQSKYIYITDYIINWNNFLSEAYLRETDSLTECLRILKNISLDTFSLFKLYKLINNKLIITNTELTDAAENNNTVIGNDQGYALIQSEVADAVKYNPLDTKELATIKEELQHNIQEITHYVASITNSTDENEAAFNAVGDFETLKNHPIKNALNTVAILPKPLDSLYANLINNVKTLLYRGATMHINRSWKEKIYDYYSNKIENKYPFNESNYDNQLLLNDFIEFFSEDGIVNGFILKYLKLKNIRIKEDGNKFLNYYKYIKENWFNKDGKAEIQFSIAPLKLHSTLIKVILSLSGDEMTFTQDKFEALAFKWPDNKKHSNFIKLEFIDEKNHKSTEYYEGQWAWYKVLGLDKEQQNIENSNTIFTSNAILESPLGNFELTINRSKNIPTLKNSTVNIPKYIVETTSAEGSLYDK